MDKFEVWNKRMETWSNELRQKVDEARAYMVQKSTLPGCVCGDGSGQPCAAHADAWNELTEAMAHLERAAKAFAHAKG